MMLRAFNFRFLVFLFCLLTFSSIGQIKEPTISLVRNLDGYRKVLNSEVNDACIDSLGYLRIFGAYGVVRYDGIEFKNAPYDEGMNDFNLRCFKDDLNRVWLVKMSGGLSYFRNDSLFHYKPSDSIKDLIVRGRFESLAFDEDSILHIGTRGKGYFKLYPNGHLEKVLGRESGLNGFMVLERSGKSAITFSISYAENTAVKPYKFHYLDKNLNVKYSSLIDYQWPKYLSSLSQFKDSSYLLTLGNSKIIHFNANEIKDTITYSSSIVRTFVDSRDEIWIGTDDNGVHRFYDLKDVNEKKPEEYLKSSVAYVLCENNRGGIWLKSIESGLSYIPNTKVRVFANPRISRNNSILFANQNVAYFDDGAYMLKMKRNGLVEKLPSPLIYKEKSINQLKSSLYYDSISDRLWLGGRRHISYYDGKKWQKPSFAEEMAKIGTVRSLSNTNDPKVICIGVGNRVFWIRKDSIIDNQEVSKNPLLKLLPGGNGKMWIATADGLKSYENGELKSYGHINKALDERIYDLFMYKDKLWMAFLNNVAYLDGDSLHIITDFQRYGLFPHSKDGFWNKCANGQLVHITMDENDSTHFQYYDLNDRLVNGIQGRSFCWGDTLFLSTLDGLRHIRSRDLDTTLSSPTVIVDQIVINSKRRAFRYHYELNHNEDLIQFKYSAIDYHLNGEQVHFRFKLKGLEEEWFDTDETFARFTSLDPGSYQFILEAKTDNSEVFCEPIKISFIIHPPYWEAWWFRTLMALVGIVGIVAIFRFQLKAQKRKDQLLIDKLLAEQQALRAQLNPHFIFNSLSSIQHLVFNNDKIFVTESIAVFAKLMRKVLTLSQKEWVSLKEEIETLQLYLQLEGLRFEEHFDYSIDIAHTINTKDIMVPTLLLQPIVENAIRHGLLKKDKPGGKIIIKAFKEGTELVLEILDNGIGVSKAKKLKGKDEDEHVSFGLNSLNRRIEILNASFKMKASFSLDDRKDSEGKILGSMAQIRMQIRTNDN